MTIEQIVYVTKEPFLSTEMKIAIHLEELK